MQEKKFTLIASNDALFSLKIQKHIGNVQHGKIGQREYQTLFTNFNYVDENENNPINTWLPIFVLTINDDLTPHVNSYHLHVLYELLSSVFNYKYDFQNHYNDAEDISNHSGKYILMVENIEVDTLTKINNIINSLFYYENHVDFCFDFMPEHDCISFYNLIDCNLTDFLRFCFVILFLETITINIFPNYPELILKNIKYIVENSLLTNNQKTLLIDELHYMLPENSMLKFYKNII